MRVCHDLFVSKHLTLPNKVSNRGFLPHPTGAVLRSDHMEMQTQTPSTGSINISILEFALDEKRSGQSECR